MRPNYIPGMQRLAPLLALLWACCLPAAAGESASLRLGMDLPWSMLVDDSGLDIDQVAALPAQQFQSQTGPLAQGPRNGTVWLRFAVPADWHPGDELWLQVSPRSLNSVQLYRPADRERGLHWRASESGDGLPYARREFDHSTLVFRLRSYERSILYLRVQTSGLLVVGAALHTPEGFNAESDRFFAAFGIYTGVSLIAVVLLLLGAQWFRNRALAVVALAWLVSWLQQCAARGLVSQYVFPDSFVLSEGAMPLLTAAAIAASIWVVREEFTRDGVNHTLDRLLVALALMTLLLPLGMVFNPTVGAGGLVHNVNILALALGMIALGLGLFVSLRGIREHGAARLVAAPALSVSLLIMLLGNLAALGLLPHGETLPMAWAAATPVALAVVAVAKVIDIRRGHSQWRRRQMQTLQDALIEGARTQKNLRERTVELLKTQGALHHALNAEHRLLLEQRQFFAMISHEFRTPLTIVDNVATAQLRFPAHNEEEQVQRARQIRGAVRRLSSLVNNCLVDERLSAGGFVLQRQRVAVAPLVEAAGELIVLGARQRVEIDITQAPAKWDCDPTLLRIAISNLADNAAKYSRQGKIRISALQMDGELLIAVSDDGPGIPPQDRARIFEAFERGRQSDEGGGYGFGLYVTRKIVRLHGGDVTMANSYLGGTAFHLRIPPVMVDTANAVATA